MQYMHNYQIMAASHDLRVLAHERTRDRVQIAWIPCRQEENVQSLWIAIHWLSSDPILRLVLCQLQPGHLSLRIGARFGFMIQEVALGRACEPAQHPRCGIDRLGKNVKMKQSALGA